MTTSADQYVDPHEDRRTRFLPSRTAVQTAVAALQANPNAEVAVVPMYMPGKQYNNWTVGQRVESVELPLNLVLLAVDAPQSDGAAPTVQDRREEAHDLAAAALAELGSGTTAYAVVRRDSTAMVFEEILSAR